MIPWNPKFLYYCHTFDLGFKIYNLAVWAQIQVFKL